MLRVGIIGMGSIANLNILGYLHSADTEVVGGERDVKSYGEELSRDWRYFFINSTKHFINIMKTGKREPIHNGEQGKNLCIFA